VSNIPFKDLAVMAATPDDMTGVIGTAAKLWKSECGRACQELVVMESVVANLDKVHAAEIESLKAQLADPMTILTTQAREAFAPVKSPEHEEATIGGIKYDIFHRQLQVYIRGPGAIGNGGTWSEALASAVESYGNRLKREAEAREFSAKLVASRAEADQAAAVNAATDALLSPSIAAGSLAESEAV
jgi:hypothetical protein